LRLVFDGFCWMGVAGGGRGEGEGGE
jgi:hypothetical protein